jgi:DNA-binding LytR/AlgR family response regulator
MMIFIPQKGDFDAKNFFYPNVCLNFVFENNNTTPIHECKRPHFKNENTQNRTNMKTVPLSNLIVVSDSDNKKHPIDVHVVVKVKAEDGMTKVYFYNHRILVFDMSIKAFDEILSPHGFIKIHKACIINPAYLEGVKPGRIAMARLSDDTEEPVSREIRKILSTYIIDAMYS